MAEYETITHKIEKYEAESGFKYEVELAYSKDQLGHLTASDDKLSLVLKDGTSFSFDGTRIEARPDMVYMARMLFSEHTMRDWEKGFHYKIISSDEPSLLERMEDEDRLLLSQFGQFDCLQNTVAIDQARISKYLTSDWELLGHDEMLPYIAVHAFLKMFGFYDLKRIKNTSLTLAETLMPFGLPASRKPTTLGDELKNIRVLLKDRFDPEEIGLITEFYTDIVIKLAEIKKEADFSIESIAKLSFSEEQTFQDSFAAYLIVKNFGQGRPLEQILEQCGVNKELARRLGFNYNKIDEICESFYDRLEAKIVADNRNSIPLIEELGNPSENIVLVYNPEIKKRLLEALQGISKSCFVLNPQDLLWELEAIAGQKSKFYEKDFPIEEEKESLPAMYRTIQRIKEGLLENFENEFKGKEDQLAKKFAHLGKKGKELRKEIRKAKLDLFDEYRAAFFERLKPELTGIVNEIIDEVRKVNDDHSFLDKSYLFRSIREAQHVFSSLDKFLEHCYSITGLDPESDVLLVARLRNCYDRETAWLCAEYYHNDNVVDKREKAEIGDRANDRKRGSRVNFGQLQRMVLDAYDTNPYYIELSDEIIRYFIEIREDRLYSIHEQMSVEELKRVQEDRKIIHPHLFKFLYFLLQHNITREEIPSKGIEDFISKFKIVLHEGLHNPYYDPDTNKLLKELTTIYARAKADDTKTASGDKEYQLIERIITNECERWERETEQRRRGRGKELTKLIFRYRTPDIIGCIDDCSKIGDYFHYFDEAHLLGQVGHTGKMLSFAQFQRFNKARMALNELDPEIFKKYCAEKVLSSPTLSDDARGTVQAILDVIQTTDEARYLKMLEEQISEDIVQVVLCGPETIDKAEYLRMVKEHILEEHKSIAAKICEFAYPLHLYNMICKKLVDKGLKKAIEKGEIKEELELNLDALSEWKPPTKKERK